MHAELPLDEDAVHTLLNSISLVLTLLDERRPSLWGAAFVCKAGLSSVAPFTCLSIAACIHVNTSFSPHLG